ncbi:hypothetical protein [Halomarina litorea]|uniref:hypothetical protein n=1 Tax=Halomarina litorea TaxID=2961595 RepID=UPI0020C347BD|nr:hypothetical protein [Halomarina sp. BCD28]
MPEQYRVTAPNYGAPGNRREQGEVFEPTEAEISAFRDKLEPVEDESDDGGEASDQAGEEDDASAPFDPSDMTIDEFEGELDGGDYGEDELAALAVAEREGKHRDGAINAIEAAREDEE